MDKWMVGMRILWQSKITSLFIFWLLCGPCIAEVLQKKTIDFSIEQIPSKDRERIAYFFRHAIFWDTYGYVLLGDKPCAITSYNRMTLNPLSWPEYFTPHNLKMKKGWETWCRYEKLFPHPNFLFVEEDSPLTFAHFIVLIHHGKFLQQVHAHQKDFQTVLQKTNGENLLAEAKFTPFLTQVLKNHDGLIGTLLGYGRNNAWAFHEKSKKMGSFTDEKEHLRMKNFCQQQGSWKFFTGSFCRDFSYLPLPGFVADPNDPETKMLKDIYSKNRHKIVHHYHKKNFLETTLNLLCQSK